MPLGEPCGRGFPVIDALHDTGLAIMNEHESATAKIASPWQRYRKSKYNRDAGINCVTTRCEDFQADLGGQIILGRNHRFCGNDWRMDVIIT